MPDHLHPVTSGQRPQRQRRGFQLLLWLSLTLAASSHADVVATVTRIEGDVRIFDHDGGERRVLGPGDTLLASETIATGEQSRVALSYGDGSITVLEENSGLLLTTKKLLRYLSGTLYFVINKVAPGETPVSISTGAATIGIRGTTFAIYDEQQGNAIALKEGLLNIESTTTPFEVRSPAPVNEFEAFKQQRQEGAKAREAEFRDYVARQQREFVEYKQAFLLKAHQVVRFEGQKATQKPLDDSYLQDFDRFAAFLNTPQGSSAADTSK